jgi:Glycosyl transferase family 2
MLSELGEQVMDLDRERWSCAEVLILYDPVVTDPGLIHRIARENINDTFMSERFRLLPAEGKHYYELKNYGAMQTTGNIVIFLDSDVVPESQWLMSLLSAVSRPEVDVVCGNTYVPLTSIYFRIFALFWFFPLRSATDDLKQSPHFFANNVAFRRRTLEPHHPKFRGQCVDPAHTLIENGFGLYIAEGARVRHPPPSGVCHLIARALCEGHDSALVSLDKKLSPERWGWHRFKANLRSSRATIRDRLAATGLSRATGILAFGTAAIYFLFAYLGEVITARVPSFIPRHFPI